MGKYAINFKVSGTYSVEVEAPDKEDAVPRAIAAFLKMPSEVHTGRLQLDPKEQLTTSPDVLTKALSFVEGQEPVDWGGIDDALAILEGELGKHPRVARVIDAINAAVGVARTYPEDPTFNRLLRERRRRDRRV